ncbi:MAG: YajG family lipoprotein [Gammaproteobacteria bacterium]|nr:MAG: YajG family lipoprotein [Gammaproteobacteria bacterium]
MSRFCRGVRPVFHSLRTILTVTLLGLAVTSCARSPQVVTLSPALTGPPGKIAVPRTVELSVRDDRSSKVIGSRGGLYAETSTITTEGDITAGLTELLAEKLEQQGYTVVSPGSGGEVKLSVELQKLTYEMGGSVLTEINLSSSVGVTATRGGETLSSRYETNHRQEFATVPNEEKNSELINMVVGKTLDEMLGDKELRDFMSK